jgi:flavin-dependent thymidylate synthase
VTQSDSKPTRQGLQVILAGYNGDVEVLRTGRGTFSPETLSAAYARISRYPAPIPKLRAKAREEVERARKSNRMIVFGLGHHSVAEHAVFNFDILGCSRLAIEALEWHRLCSYTEKSQRYITLKDDTVIPSELDGDERAQLEALIAAQNQSYHDLLPLLDQRQAELHPEMLERKQDRSVIEGWAKEDARYVVSLATAGQLGFTCNARNLELIVRRLRQAPLQEVRQLGGMLFDQASQIAPSLIILADSDAFRETYGFTLREDYYRQGDDDLVKAAATVDVPRDSRVEEPKVRRRGDVTLLSHTHDPDSAVISALLFTAGRGSLADCCQAADRMTQSDRMTLIKGALAHLSEFDSPPRAFEEAVFRFELIIDASAFAQLKRHRMTTQHWGPYDPELGVTVPPAVTEIGQAEAFGAIMDRSAETFRQIRTTLQARTGSGAAATYGLTNAHRRRVALTMTLREAYHFSRLREDQHAQWAIREIAADISALVREVAPATALLLAGKHRFAELFSQVMGSD